MATVRSAIVQPRGIPQTATSRGHGRSSASSVPLLLSCVSHRPSTYALRCFRGQNSSCGSQGSKKQRQIVCRQGVYVSTALEDKYRSCTMHLGKDHSKSCS